MQPEPHAPPGTVSPRGLWRLVRTLRLVGLIAALAVGLVLPDHATRHRTFPDRSVGLAAGIHV